MGDSSDKKHAEKQDGSGSFEVQKLGKLMRLMEKYGVTELQVSNGDEKWRLQRGPKTVAAAAPVAVAAPVQAAASAPTPAPAASAAPSGGGDSSGGKAEAEGTFVTSPEVGTFYTKPDPGDPPFVKVGDRVSPDTVVCLIEQMKVFNEITAGVSGTVEEMLVSEGDTVEFGTKLYRIRPG